jgi:hypothetical protein
MTMFDVVDVCLL